MLLLIGGRNVHTEINAYQFVCNHDSLNYTVTCGLSKSDILTTKEVDELSKARDENQ